MINQLITTKTTRLLFFLSLPLLISQLALSGQTTSTAQPGKAVDAKCDPNDKASSIGATQDMIASMLNAIDQKKEEIALQKNALAELERQLNDSKSGVLMPFAATLPISGYHAIQSLAGMKEYFTILTQYAESYAKHPEIALPALDRVNEHMPKLGVTLFAAALPSAVFFAAMPNLREAVAKSKIELAESEKSLNEKNKKFASILSCRQIGTNFEKGIKEAAPSATEAVHGAGGSAGSSK